MPYTLVPFLYRTRTLQGALCLQYLARSVRLAHTSRGNVRKHDNSIPFEWDAGTQLEDMMETSGKESTITPSEAQVFKGIFDEIAQGRMPSSKQRLTVSGKSPLATVEDELSGTARSMVEQVRVMEFRERILRRYPASLRNAAQVALGLYELEPSGGAESKMLDLNETDQTKWKERSRYEQERVQERERVDSLMSKCQNDVDLWRVMEAHVFSLPAKLGIAQGEKGSRTKRSKRRARGGAAGVDEDDAATTSSKQERVMDVHGPLYSHFINNGLALFETAFDRPSDYALQILPRIKQLGLASYVLGVSTPFYARLARMHWTRFGDANSALDTLQEMNSAGLYADDEVHGLLQMMRDHLHGCSWGAQGPFVMGMMEASPYDGMLTQRLEEMERYTVHSMNERAAELGEA